MLSITLHSTVRDVRVARERNKIDYFGLIFKRIYRFFFMKYIRNRFNTNAIVLYKEACVFRIHFKTVLSFTQIIDRYHFFFFLQ